MFTKRPLVLLPAICVILIAGAFRLETAQLPTDASPEQAVLTNAAAVRTLTPEQAGQRLPVQFQGIVTFVFNQRSCFVQDKTAGIYVGDGQETPTLSPGDLVQVEGITEK